MALPRDYKKGIPGIPTAALEGVKDESTRMVLKAIVDGWNVRNASSGTGDARFITAAELGDVKTAMDKTDATVRSLQSAVATPPEVNQSDIARIINDLQALVIESLLFKELGDRITLIETVNAAQGNTINQEIANRVNGDNAILQYTNTQISRIDGNIGAIQTQQTTTANNVAALAQTVTTVQAQTATNTTAIQTEATARVNADNSIYSKYSVKIDQNGYVSGFGLISTANNSTPFSEFIIRADRFSIASPSGPGITPKVPFIVTTTNTILADGTVVPPGVYIDTAVVKRLDGAFINAGLLNAAKIYTGSEYIDFVTKQPVSAMAAASAFEPLWTFSGGTPTPWVSQVSANARMYGATWHTFTSSVGYAPVTKRNRVRSLATGEKFSFFVTVNCAADHYISIWYRLSSGTPDNWSLNSTWTPASDSFAVAVGDNQQAVSLSVEAVVEMTNGQWIEFTVAPVGLVGGVWQPLNPAKTSLNNVSILIQAPNL